MFRVGQKVEYVGDDYSKYPGLARDYSEFPLPRAIYTIRAQQEPSLYLLQEIAVVHRATGVEIAVNDFLLRPVVERKTDISLFTAMLNPTKQKERV
jgi:hypothetical protein